MVVEELVSDVRGPNKARKKFMFRLLYGGLKWAFRRGRAGMTSRLLHFLSGHVCGKAGYAVTPVPGLMTIAAKGDHACGFVRPGGHQVTGSIIQPVLAVVDLEVAGGQTMDAFVAIAIQYPATESPPFRMSHESGIAFRSLLSGMRPPGMDDQCMT